jgi:hypothetical protein
MLIAAALLRPALADEPAPAPTMSPSPAASPTVQPSPAPSATPHGIEYELGAQATLIWQKTFHFRSPYQGPNSFRSSDDAAASHTYTIYTGVRIGPHTEFYVDPEMARGSGLSAALGMAGFVNGDVIRNPFLGHSPYFGRYFGRFTFNTGKTDDVEKVEPGENQIAGVRPADRLVITLGKLGTNDIFDVNAYANSTRTQFMNWALINDAAYDYAADTRGYSRGLAIEWVHPDWAIRAGTFQMPRVANGLELDNNFWEARGDQFEGEVHTHWLAPTQEDAGIFRVLLYRNEANMGDYREALQLAALTHSVPSIVATRRPGRTKFGLGLNFQQPLADHGDTGLFARLGWNDGHTESFAYTECDASASVGAQLSGTHWHRPRDHVALALVQNMLGTPHIDYLAAGGVGFILGDGHLTYAPERILEAYYTISMTHALSFSLDYQHVSNPGYNSDRGPAGVYGLRMHLEY